VYISAVTQAFDPEPQLPKPPATKTVPSASDVAVCSIREEFIEPVAAKEELDGVKISAEDRVVPEVFCPPARRTVPSVNGVAVCWHRVVVKFPTRLNVCVEGL
jgi:hypothetical protein